MIEFIYLFINLDATNMTIATGRYDLQMNQFNFQNESIQFSK